MFVTSKEYYNSCGGLDNYTGQCFVHRGSNKVKASRTVCFHFVAVLMDDTTKRGG